MFYKTSKNKFFSAVTLYFETLEANDDVLMIKIYQLDKEEEKMYIYQCIFIAGCQGDHKNIRLYIYLYIYCSQMIR